MNAAELLQTLEGFGIALRADGAKLSIVGDQRRLADPALMASLRAHKAELLELIGDRDRALTYRLPEGLARLTPELLPLVALTQAQLDELARLVPGGAANIQDIYPLAPLQEGILFHHRLHDEGDAYVLPTLLRFDSRQRMDRFVRALDEVVARHDILRTSVHWEGLEEPVQVVWRDAQLEIETLSVATPGATSSVATSSVATPSLATPGAAEAQLAALADPRRVRLDLGRAPLLRGHAIFDEAQGAWLLQLLHHHLVLDHTASELLVREVMTILQGRRAELPPPVPFRGFVARARRGMAAAEHEAYFRAQLGDVEAPTAPFDHLDVQGDGSGLARETAPLEPQLAQRLRRLARARGVSAASLFHLAWARVLASCTGRDDVVFGTVLFGRLQAGAEAARAMGMFLNTLPLRVQLGQDSVEQAVGRVHSSLVELLRHEHAALALAQRCSAVPANLPLFTSLLNYRYGHGEAGLALDGVEHLGGHDRTNYPFVLDVDDLGEGFALTAETHAGCAPARLRAAMERVLGALATALEQTPGAPVAELAALPEAERHQVIETFNAGAAAAAPALVHAAFERHAAAQPQAIALVHEGRQLSYGELEARANGLARRLRRLGVKPEARVAICAERGLELIVAVLATLKAGGAYVPMDPAYPEARLAHMLADSAPTVVLAARATAARLAVPAGCAVLALDEAAADDDDDALATEADAATLAPAHLAYVIYTSGSTGTPKGVMVEHRQLAQQVAALHELYGFRTADRVLQFAALSFDVAAEEIFGALSHGATLVLRSEAWLTGAADFCALCAQHGVTIANLPTGFWQQLAHDDAAPLPPALRQIIIGGDAVSEAALRAWWQRPGHRPALANAYGPTETTINATVARCAAEDEPRSIGRPVAGARVYVLDDRRQPVAMGAAGELWIGGPIVARGYLGRGELTAERFVDDPFAPTPAAAGRPRMYRSGDLGRWRADGTLEFLGRKDGQVKLRGYRIELGEIEAQLAQRAELGEAAVLLREDVAGAPRLVAYVTAALGAPGAAAPEPAQLRAWLAERLPDYMVPAAYVVLAALPLMPNGKLDRRALPAPEGEAYSRHAYEAPRGEIEEALAGWWAELLGAAQVGRHDNFFELGGQSLLAVQLMERVRRHGWTIDVRTLFLQPQLAAMAAAVRTERDAGADDGRRVIEVPRNAIPAELGRLAPDMNLDDANPDDTVTDDDTNTDDETEELRL